MKEQTVQIIGKLAMMTGHSHGYCVSKICNLYGNWFDNTNLQKNVLVSDCCDKRAKFDSEFISDEDNSKGLFAQAFQRGELPIQME